MAVEDQQRLVRLLRRTLGTGFKLAFIEVPNARSREAILRWLAPVLHSADGQLRRLNVRDAAGSGEVDNFNLWGVLHEVAPPESVARADMLTLWGFEDVMYRGRTDRSQLLQQINVQRDILVRDYRCWWLLFVHPESRQQWWSVAPDFCDLVAMWVEAPEEITVFRNAGRVEPQRDLGSQRASASAAIDTREWPSLLSQANEDLRLSRLAEALDAIHSFRTGATKNTRDFAIADMLESSIHAMRGNPEVAIRLLRENVLPAFESTKYPLLRAAAYGRLADVLEMRGELDETLRIRREEQLPIYEHLGDIHSRALTLGNIADILAERGEIEEALRIRLEEELPVFKRLGDVREHAITMGRIADLREARGELEEALRIRKEEQLPTYERINDVRSRAVTIGKIADVLHLRGEIQEALRMRREQLPVFEHLGDVRARAITVGKIADGLEQSGESDEALRIRREEELPVYEQLGDLRSRAITVGKIADILEQRGQADEALRIRREEELPVYEQLGDIRSRAVTMSKIADVLAQRGEAEAALRIRLEEELPAFERLGDVRNRAITMSRIADALTDRGEVEEVLRIRRDEELPVYERMGDVRSAALTLAQIGDALEVLGDFGGAKTAYEQALSITEQLLGPADAKSESVRAKLKSLRSPTNQEPAGEAQSELREGLEGAA